MNIRLVIRDSSGASFASDNVLRFTFRKDAYVPYTALTVRAVMDADITDAAEVKLYIGSRLIHHGLADSVRSVYSGGKRIVLASSRGFTSLLCQNQIPPGLKTGVSLNSLMNGYYLLPNVTHEDNSDVDNYIYVDKNSTMWDGIANLCFRLNGRYPYIRGANNVRITPVAPPRMFEYTASQLLSTGTELTGRRLISNFHMADIAGEYGTYELQDDDAISMKVIRHKFFDLDMEFLRDPDNALVYRDNIASRGKKHIFCSYSGYNGEDLSDVLSFGAYTEKRISTLKVTGSSSGVITEVGFYEDNFPH